VTKAQVEAYEQQQHVISARLLAGKTILHIYSDTRPDDGFFPVDPSLEDAYFYHLSA
jgi:ABC-2 type transport system ATP-binding protein